MGQANLAIDGAQIEEDSGFLEVNVLLRGLLPVLEGVVPDEGEGIDVVVVGGDREAGLDEAEGFEVALEEVAAGGEGRVWLALDVGAELL